MVKISIPELSLRHVLPFGKVGGGRPISTIAGTVDAENRAWKAMRVSKLACLSVKRDFRYQVSGERKKDMPVNPQLTASFDAVMIVCISDRASAGPTENE